jgi:8-oxo-dGTP pyrophosphatase MutT (NUDIX family)
MRLTKGFSVFEVEAVTHRQVAALCWRRRNENIDILLVTSRETGRWVLPKGWPIAGLSDAEAAASEAFEEAGVQGKLAGGVVGTFYYAKVIDRSGPVGLALSCLVSVYGLRVTRLRNHFPESGERRRKWFSQEIAATKVDEPELKALIAGFSPDTPSCQPAAESGPCKP